MLKVSFILSFLIGLLTGTHPKDVTGKWIVDHVETGNVANNMPLQQKQQMVVLMNKYFRNASFILQPNHKCEVSVNMPDMPKINYWSYNAAKGIVTLSTDTRGDDKIMMFEVTEQNGGTFFAMLETTAVLKVHKVL